ncbi:hypothetical protein [Pedobacter frigoris]|uniref:Helix-turn-helix domain-containing protein n=1 Tax=Pedobacter frigoris TaxID=2571272 RepID=A0A4U1CQ34_9SPHI|nr:hypothetical protein [Pedobacter frigoris]TKC08990.1 hypothetical protein FA047_02525 [Pedobacter frigoris]
MNEEILEKLGNLMELQRELNVMMTAISHKVLLPEQEEVWLTKAAVMDELCITSRTFYRRRVTENWETKVSGGQVYYLKASLRR